MVFRVVAIMEGEGVKSFIIAGMCRRCSEMWVQTPVVTSPHLLQLPIVLPPFAVFVC
jgi:hypothetical protein